MARLRRSVALRQTPAARRVVAALAAFLAPRLKADSTIGVALSGGLDSVVLLHALSVLRGEAALLFVLQAIHVHHGLSPNAEPWAQFCGELCEKLTVPLSVVRVSVPRDSGEGLEAAARRLRHAAFAASDVDWLALAHHADDQAETLLLNLLRGAGVAGAAAMRPERPNRQGPTLIRPLLDLPRAVLQAYAEECGLSWIDDESNGDTHFRRNFLRHEILPRLDAKFPTARAALARAASHFAEASELLDELAVLDRAAVAAPSGRLALAAFNALAPARARNLLRLVWREAGFRAPDARWLDEACTQLRNAESDSELCVATPDGALHAYRGELYLVRHTPDVAGQAVAWQGEPEIAWAGGVVRFVETIGAGIARRWLQGAALTIRARQGGERIKHHPARPRRNLRNVLQESGLPPWERERLPFLWREDRLMWVGGVGVEVAFACAPDEAGVQPVWIAEGEGGNGSGNDSDSPSNAA